MLLSTESEDLLEFITCEVTRPAGQRDVAGGDRGWAAKVLNKKRGFPRFFWTRLRIVCCVLQVGDDSCGEAVCV